MTRPTIKELEHILNGGDGPAKIEILPNGEIRAIPENSLNMQKLWNDLSETQQRSVLKMAAMERSWHYASVEIRHNAEDHHFDGTFLREILRAFAKCASS